MPEENMNQEQRLKKIDETRNYLIEEKNKWIELIELIEERNELMIKKHKNVCKVLNYIYNSHIVISTISGCVFSLHLLLY